MVSELKPFDTIKYQTSYGENCVATKNNGVVTIQGDKKGVRQMPFDDFMEEFVYDQSKKTNLERIPEKDSVSFNGSGEKPKKKGKGFLNCALGGWLASNIGNLIFNKKMDKAMAAYDAEFKAKGATKEVEEMLKKLTAKITKGGKVFKALNLTFMFASVGAIVNYIVKNKTDKI